MENKSLNKTNSKINNQTNVEFKKLKPSEKISVIITLLVMIWLGYLIVFKVLPFAIGKTGEFIGFTGNHIGRFVGGIGNGIGDIFDGDKKTCNNLIKDIDKISSLDDFNKKTNNKEIYSKCESKHIDISKVKELGEKLEKEKSEKEERIKKEKEEKEK